ncbi:MAG: T9SS type A sorting domain-containing protein [Bacteroidales bacterium]
MNSREVSQVVRLQFLEEETEDPTHVPGVAGLETMLRVFPNPARDYLAIEPILNEPFTVSLFDMRGVQWLQTQNTHRIDVSQMPRGVYILRIEQSGMIYRSKVQLYP